MKLKDPSPMRSAIYRLVTSRQHRTHGHRLQSGYDIFPIHLGLCLVVPHTLEDIGLALETVKDIARMSINMVVKELNEIWVGNGPSVRYKKVDRFVGLNMYMYR